MTQNVVPRAMKELSKVSLERERKKMLPSRIVMNICVCTSEYKILLLKFYSNKLKTTVSIKYILRFENCSIT